MLLRMRVTSLARMRAASRPSAPSHVRRFVATPNPTCRTCRPCSINQFSHAVFITIPYTLAVYMVRAFHGEGGGTGSSAEEEASVGRLTGMLAAAASAAQTCTSYPWGLVSDRLGRKPVILTANISAALSMLALGLAPSYAWAIVVRALGGLMTSGNGV